MGYLPILTSVMMMAAPSLCSEAGLTGYGRLRLTSFGFGATSEWRRAIADASRIEEVSRLFAKHRELPRAGFCGCCIQRVTRQCGDTREASARVRIRRFPGTGKGSGCHHEV